MSDVTDISFYPGGCSQHCNECRQFHYVLHNGGWGHSRLNPDAEQSYSCTWYSSPVCCPFASNWLAEWTDSHWILELSTRLSLPSWMDCTAAEPPGYIGVIDTLPYNKLCCLLRASGYPRFSHPPRSSLVWLWTISLPPTSLHSLLFCSLDRFSDW